MIERERGGWEKTPSLKEKPDDEPFLDSSSGFYVHRKSFLI